jgi:hypothetical protein
VAVFQPAEQNTPNPLKLKECDMVDKERVSASESLRSTRTFGKVRCHNPSCMGRITPPPGSKQISCPTCGMTYRLFWVTPELPRIRGPVWDVNRKLAQDILEKKTGASDGDSN